MTAPMDAKLRKASLEDLLAILLRARSQEEPVILVLEDCHWIDSLSRDLLEVLGRATAAPAGPDRRSPTGRRPSPAAGSASR